MGIYLDTMGYNAHVTNKYNTPGCNLDIANK